MTTATTTDQRRMFLEAIDKLLSRTRPALEYLESSLEGTAKRKHSDVQTPLGRYGEDVLDVIGELKGVDVEMFFWQPVNKTDVDLTYWDIVSTPMDFSTVEHKIRSGQYKSFIEMYADLYRIFRNVEVYHPSTSHVAQVSNKVSKNLSSSISSKIDIYKNVPGLAEPLKQFIDAKDPMKTLNEIVLKMHAEEDLRKRLAGEVPVMSKEYGDLLTDKLERVMEHPQLSYEQHARLEAIFDLDPSIDTENIIVSNFPAMLQWKLWYTLDEWIPVLGIDMSKPKEVNQELPSPQQFVKAEPVKDMISSPMLGSDIEDGKVLSWDAALAIMGGGEKEGVEEDSFGVFQAEVQRKREDVDAARERVEREKAAAAEAERAKELQEQAEMETHIIQQRAVLHEEFSGAQIHTENALNKVLNTWRTDGVGIDSFNHDPQNALTSPSPLYAPSPAYNTHAAIPSPTSHPVQTSLDLPAGCLIDSPSYGDELRAGLTPTSPQLGR
eukprot:TRINITY_DN37571_c0_g1_i1.p1 TRINITY_DN37571_c0_g1~~TRINITY_DN37571_c0_g1_i1.p1  ORF type:complete len:508 (+),score=118.40 TRINITY_DN37571_c0_g1_i1:41-1525(+)